MSRNDHPPAAPLDPVEVAAATLASLPDMTHRRLRALMERGGGPVGALAGLERGLASAVLCGRRVLVPPVSGLRQVDPACGPLNFALEASPLPGPYALLSGIASGGALAAAVVRVNR